MDESPDLSQPRATVPGEPAPAAHHPEGTPQAPPPGPDDRLAAPQQAGRAGGDAVSPWFPIEQSSADADFLQIVADLGDVFSPAALTKTLAERAGKVPITDESGRQLGTVADAHLEGGQLHVKAAVPFVKKRRPTAVRLTTEPVKGRPELRLVEVGLRETVTPEERAALLDKAAALVAELREAEDQWLLAEAARQKAQYGHVKPWFMPKVHHLLKEDE